MNSLTKSAIGIVVLCMLGGGARATVIADLAQDWSDVFNPNGAWAYRKGPIILGSVPSYTPLSPAQPAWAPGTAAGNFLPPWFKSVADYTGDGVDLTTGDIGTHSVDCFNGDDRCNLASNVVWTSTVNQLVTISGKVWDADTVLGRSNQYTLLLNGTPIDFGDLLFGIATRSNPVIFSLTALVDVGDKIELDITRLQDEGTWAGVVLTISDVAVPEPASLLTLSLGLIALGFSRRALAYRASVLQRRR